MNPELLYYLYAVAVAAGTFFSEIGGVQRSNYILLSGLSPELVPHVVGCFLGGAVVKKQNTTLL